MADPAESDDQHGPSKKNRQPFERLVIIGSSAGGIDALIKLVGMLPADFPAPIVIAQHLDRRHESHLGEILSNISSIPVRTVCEHEKLAPGFIYVVAPDLDVEINDHAILVGTDENPAPKPSVDRLLGTAAPVFTDSLVAVILTGTGTDGAAGAQTVKALGGTVIVQNPETATYPGMPLAVPPSAVDIVAELEAIGPLLVDLVSGVYVIPVADGDGDLRAFLDRVRERTGLDFSGYKRPTIVRRLERRMAAVGARTLHDYRRYLERHPDELQRLVASFLIKVTEFFRDPDLFTNLRDHVLPGLIEEGRRRGELRIWSAGCATGEEAYTLAMLVFDLLGDDLDKVAIRIYATDLAADAVAFARRGVYPEAALEALPPELIERYFTRLDGRFEVNKKLRSIVIFGEHDLGNRAPFPRIDLVLCRNVLIYFTTELQRRALQLFAFSLRQGGFLVLGKAETVTPLPESFSLEQPRLKVYRRIGEAMSMPTDQLIGAVPLSKPVPQRNRQVLSAIGASADFGNAPPHGTSSGLQAARLLDQLSTGTAIINREYHIRTINIAARRLLGIRTAAIGEDLIHRVLPELAGPLREAIDAALRGERSNAVYQISDDLAEEGGRDLLITTHAPFEEDRPVNEVILEVVEITPLARQFRAEIADHEQLQARSSRQTSQTDRATGELRELRSANQLMAIETANLRCENEDLQIAVEEAQAAAEEIETHNEELQATNEELETLNEELQATVEELTTTNDELQVRTNESLDLAAGRETDRQRLEDILQGAPSGMIVIEGPDHAFRFANVAGLEQLGRDEEDLIGRPVASVLPEFRDHGLVEMLDQVFATGKPFVRRELLIQHDRNRDGELEDHYYDVVYQPLKDQNTRIEAILIQSIDATDRVRARQNLEATLAAMSDAIMVVAPNEQLLLTNATYDRIFAESGSLAPEDETGQPLAAELWPERRAARGESFVETFTVRNPTGIRQWYEASGQPLLVEGTQRGGVVVIRDVTDRSLRHLQEKFLSVAGHELRTPLTALSLSIDLAARRLQNFDDERVLQHIARAAQQTRRLTELAREIVDVARLQTSALQLDREPVDLTNLIPRILDTAQVIAGDQPIEYVEDESPVFTSADSRRMEQVLLNLIGNAISFTGGVGPIEVTLRRVGDTAEIQVRDHGPGIPSHVLPRIFERFYRVDDDRSAREGLGLGLYIAREIVDAHGGEIEARSESGHGATFIISLPLLESESTQEPIELETT